MVEEIVKIADLKTPEINTRNHPEKQIDELCKSYQQFGQIRPFVIDEDNNVWAGNGLLAALRRLGVETGKAYRVTGLSETQKRKLMLADNKTFSLGFDNLIAIDDVMKSLDDFEIPGYDPDTLERLYAEIDEVTEGAAAFDGIDEEEVKAIKEKENEEREKVQAAVPVTPQPAPAKHEPAVEHEPLPKSEVRKFVICPKCGEKIWL